MRIAWRTDTRTRRPILPHGGAFPLADLIVSQFQPSLCPNLVWCVTLSSANKHCITGNLHETLSPTEGVRCSTADRGLEHQHQHTVYTAQQKLSSSASRHRFSDIHFFRSLSFDPQNGTVLDIDATPRELPLTTWATYHLPYP